MRIVHLCKIMKIATPLSRLAMTTLDYFNVFASEAKQSPDQGFRSGPHKKRCPSTNSGCADYIGAGNGAALSWPTWVIDVGPHQERCGRLDYTVVYFCVERNFEGVIPVQRLNARVKCAVSL